MSEPGFWDDPEKSAVITKESSDLKDLIARVRHLENAYMDVEMLIEMAKEEEDYGFLKDIEKDLGKFAAEFESLRVEKLLSGPYDREDAILTLHAGAGGTEACDWVDILYRMYTRWIAEKGYSVTILDYIAGDMIGTKGITFEVKGTNAYGFLKSEKGVHRLVRISPFNSAGKRQTTFASLDVLPDIKKDIDVEISEEDLRIDTYRASGAGGQHVNKTNSAIRITHLPTGVVVQCQNERSQFANKDKAMQMLKSKLLVLKEQAQAEKVSDLRGDMMEIGFGSQIRSYIMQPYKLVKDHRTGVETGDVERVLDGDLDPFISAYLKEQSLGGKVR